MTLSLIMLCAECHYSECRIVIYCYADGRRYAKCCNAECHYDECRYAECQALFIVMLNVVMLLSL
jgi:hypothetical protein